MHGAARHRPHAARGIEIYKRDKFNGELNGLKKNSGRNQMYAHDSPIGAETNWRTTDVTDISIGGRDAK
jgi:hypothetical protein